MKTAKFMLLILAAGLAWPDSAHSIPAFARKYGFNCNMCHSAFTKLNDFGQRYRNSGYQLPGQEGLDKNVFQTAIPLALRSSFGLVSGRTKKANTSGFNIRGLDLLAAGLLHKNISFLLVYTPRIDEPAATFTGPLNANNPSQPAALEAANLVFSNLLRDAVNVRVGKFEPAYVPFSAKRSFFLLESYEIYAFAPTDKGFVFDDNQTGVEVTGHFRNGFRYSWGVVNGSGPSPDNSLAKDVYLRAAQVIGRGEGQTAGQRIGIFGYFGWQPTAPGDSILGPTGENNGQSNMPFNRLGGDVSLNWQNFNLTGLFMRGFDNKKLVPGAAKNYIYTGGLAQLDWAGLLNNRVIGSLLFSWVTPPDFDKESRVAAYSVLLRYYLGDWSAVNVALHAEYTHREVGKVDKVKSDNLALLTDFAF